jgi:uncharacterized membrane protein (UPF0127 family)
MLFVFDKSDRYGFWMKDMHFALDICWLDDSGKVISIARNVSADSYPKAFYPKKPARMVIEANAGVFNFVQEGDRIYISL